MKGVQQLSLVGGGRFATSELDPNGSCEDWAKSTGLDWNIVESPAMYRHPDYGVMTSNKTKLLSRSDNAYELGAVGKGFSPVQPINMIKFYRKLCDLGNFQMESLGMLKGGAQMWGLAKTSFESRIMGQDKMDAYLFFITGNDSSMSTRVDFLSHRIACNNMINATYKGSGSLGWHIRHKHTSEVNFDKLFHKMSQLPEHWDTFMENAENMAKKTINEEKLIEYFVSLYGKKAESEEAMVQKKVDQLIHLAYTSPGNELRSARGTLWGALNAVTYFTDHACKAHSQENRFSSAMTGQGETLKSIAHSKALEILAS